MRWLPLVAAMAFVAISLVWLERSAVQSGVHGAGSCLDTGPEGTSLALAYLERIAHRQVARLSMPLAPGTAPAQATVFRLLPARTPEEGPPPERHAKKPRAGAKEPPSPASPPSPPSPPPVAITPSTTGLLTPAEEAWISGGGRLVLATDRADLGAKPATERQDPLVVLPLLPGVQVLHPPVGRHLDHPSLLGAAAVVCGPDGPVVVRLVIGRGELWVLACPEVLLNRHLGEADHLALLCALAGGRPLCFDAWSLGGGRDPGVADLLARWGLGPAVALALLAFLFWAWRERVILGLPADPWRDRRAEAVEGLDALAALYRRALTGRDALDLYRARLVREIAVATGAGPAAAAREAERHAGDLSLPPGEPGHALFQRTLARLNHAYRSFRDEHRRCRP